MISTELPRGPDRVLVVDDDPTVRVAISGMLAALGYSVDTVGSGADAATMVARAVTPYALVITDAVMPDMSGPDVAKRLRDLRPRLPVIFMSGYDAGKLESMYPGSSRYPLVQKPFGMRKLADAVRHAIAPG